MARNGGAISKVLNEVQQRTGYTVDKVERIERLEESFSTAKTLQRALDDLGYAVLDHDGGQEQDLTVEERRALVQKARLVWMKDPRAGAAVELMNDFVWGRGVPRPKAKDPEVQEVLDEFWDDPTNKRILTTHAAQLALGVDLSLQSNLFVLVFDDGDDGKVRLSLLAHDSVRNVVRDEEERQCHLWFVATERRYKWDFQNDAPAPVSMQFITERGRPIVRYYEHWSNYGQKVKEYEEDRDNHVADIAPPPRPPDEKIGKGKVFHIAVNKGTEMTFGHPEMDRLLRWYSAYNSFLEARVDIMRASAAFVMKRKVKGTPTQVAKQAMKALSTSRSNIPNDDGAMPGPRPGSIVTENEGSTLEQMKFDSGAAGAAADAAMLGAQHSAGTGFPPTYFGDMSSGSLATATSLELPVLKRVEARQELVEQLFRFSLDRAIERAVDTGRLSRELVDAEGQATTELGEAHEGQADDERQTERDLSYEFKMPNPLRRAMTDLISAVGQIASTFDPNNTNTALSRALLTVALAEGLEVEDAAAMVEEIFPEGYEDPALAKPAAPPEMAAPGDEGEFGASGSIGADGQRHQEGNPYGAPMRSQAPEDVMQQGLWAAASTDHRDALAGFSAGMDGVWEDVLGRAADDALTVLGG